MADFDSSLPVRTEAAGDVIVKVADATTPSQQLVVESDGSINVNAAFSAGTQVEITDGTDTLAINADGSLNATVTATDLDIRDLSASQDNVAISDGTDTLAVNADGSINAVATATDLDIRDLSSSQDSVEVLQDTHDDLNMNANLQVGDADVDNANPVPVSDAGGSLTVDATALDIRALASGTDSVTAVATDLDIRDLSASQDNVAISDGTDTLAVNSDGSINVVVEEDPGTEIVDYDTAAAVAASATSNHDWTSSAASKLLKVWASASGKLKIEVQVETGSATNTFDTVVVGFNSTANPNIDIDLRKFADVPNGARVRVIRTNRDLLAQDVYSTIVAIEG